MEFADYQCPPCIAAHQKLTALLTRRHDSLKFVFRNYPLPFHTEALPAALTAESARLQGRFWPMHDGLFQLKGEIDARQRDALVKRLALDAPRFRQAYASIALLALRRDKQDAQTLGVQGTPIFFLCGPDKRVWRLTRLEQADDFVSKPL